MRGKIGVNYFLLQLILKLIIYLFFTAIGTKCSIISQCFFIIVQKWIYDHNSCKLSISFKGKQFHEIFVMYRAGGTNFIYHGGAIWGDLVLFDDVRFVQIWTRVLGPFLAKHVWTWKFMIFGGVRVGSKFSFGEWTCVRESSSFLEIRYIWVNSVVNY